MRIILARALVLGLQFVLHIQLEPGSGRLYVISQRSCEILGRRKFQQPFTS